MRGVRPTGRWLAAVLLLLGVLGGVGRARAEVVVPAAPEGRVSDYAGVLDAAGRAALEAQLERYEGVKTQEGGAPQIAVVTVKGLEGEAIEEVALRYATGWRIGSKQDDGVLVLLAPTERKVRIEVGYGAEGRLPDALSGRIIREMMAPRLAAGDVRGGLAAGVAAVHQALLGEPVTGIDKAAGAAGPVARRGLSQPQAWGAGGGGLLLLLLVLLLAGRRGGGGFLTGMLLGSLFGGRGGGGGGGGGFSGGGGSFGGGGASGDY